jgi:hypothetical protein
MRRGTAAKQEGLRFVCVNRGPFFKETLMKMMFDEPARIEAVRLEAEQIVVEAQVHHYSLEDTITAILLLCTRERLPFPADPIAFATGAAITLDGILRAALKRSAH